MTETTTEKVSAVLAVFSQLGMLPFMTHFPLFEGVLQKPLCYLKTHIR